MSTHTRAQRGALWGVLCIFALPACVAHWLHRTHWAPTTHNRGLFLQQVITRSSFPVEQPTGPQWQLVGVTPSEAPHLQPVLEQLAYNVAKRLATKPLQTHVLRLDHMTAGFYLLDPQGQGVLFYPAPQPDHWLATGYDIIHDLQVLL